MSSLGERLQHARERKNLSQVQVFERTKINNKTLSRYEKGGSEPDIETLKILAKLYDVSVDWLTGLSADPTPSDQRGVYAGRAFLGGPDQYTEDEIEVARAAADAYRAMKRKKK